VSWSTLWRSAKNGVGPFELLTTSLLSSIGRATR
jgi:hypothetical protein